MEKTRDYKLSSYPNKIQIFDAYHKTWRMEKSLPLPGGETDMINIGIVFVAICIVVLLIYAWFRAGSLPPNARLLFDAWAAVARKTDNDTPKKDRNESPVPKNMNKA